MEPKEHQEMIDSTDSYEAAMVMKSMKNFLFWVLLVSLLAVQAIFWLDRLGGIDKAACEACAVYPAQPSVHACPITCSPVSRLTGLVPLAAQTSIAERAEQVVQQAGQTDETPSETAEPDVVIEHTVPQQLPREEAAFEASGDIEWERFRLSCRTAYGLVRAFNFILFMAAILYCLTLLMNLKISLNGKLGGINHISQAFFWSLFLLVFLTPWQTLLPGVVLGAIYLPGELLCGAWAKADTSVFWKVLLYLRFCGLWLVVVWMLLCAQSRSVKWAKATLRRLGMSR